MGKLRLAILLGMIAANVLFPYAACADEDPKMKPPENVQVTAHGLHDNKVRILWEPIETVERYAVYRLDDQGALVSLGKTSGTSFISRDYGKDVAYVVRAVYHNQEGETLSAATFSGAQYEALELAALTKEMGLGPEEEEPDTDPRTAQAYENEPQPDPPRQQQQQAAQQGDRGTGQEILVGINSQRTRGGKSAYIWDENAYQVAKARVDEMNTHRDFSHTCHTYGSMLNTYQAVTGFRPTGSGECIFAASYGFTPEQCVEAWMNSPGHREILMDSKSMGFSHAAVAIGRYDTGTGFEYAGWYYAVLVVHRD